MSKFDTCASIAADRSVYMDDVLADDGGYTGRRLRRCHASWVYLAFACYTLPDGLAHHRPAPALAQPICKCPADLATRRKSLLRAAVVDARDTGADTDPS
jgi:hypothetical protein